MIDTTCQTIRQLNEQAWRDRNKDVQRSLGMAIRAQSLIKDCSQADALDLVISLRTQGYCLDHLSRYAEALTISLKAVNLARELGELKMLASIECILGSIYWRLADYSSSLDHYIHGLRLVEIEPDPEQETFLLQGLGALHYEIGDYEEALKYFKKSVERFQSEDITGRAMGLNNTAYTLHKMKRDEDALPYALDALALYGNEPFVVGKLELLHTLGSIYLQLGDIERAATYFEEVARMAEHHENTLQVVNALFGICEIHQVRGEEEQALRKLLRILQISQEIGSLSSECSAREHLAQLYKKNGNYREALEHYETFHTIHVHIFNEQTERRLHNTRLLLKVESIQKEANLYRSLAATDALTGLLSRREFFDLAQKAVTQARLRETPISLLMIDLDNFKAVNDQNGHASGDHVLSIIARRIKSTLRQDDLAGRYGGDEFVVLIPDLDLPHCLSVAKRCQSAVSDKCIEIASSRFWINLSIGLVVSNAKSTLDLEQLIQEADKALLQAKRTGRNKIISLGFP
jgi:diguanylate cyclase (GGDEF)-like protein